MNVLLTESGKAYADALPKDLYEKEAEASKSALCGIIRKYESKKVVYGECPYTTFLGRIPAFISGGDSHHSAVYLGKMRKVIIA